ncbi:MAG: class I SAM-dependent methyltransferase [Armatimonadetes bacterium]|nr:class I SAM-dependent methyltransferase [Armatimonadota bacterium]
MPDQFYDQLGEGYDTVIDWDERLSREAPFYREVFARNGVQSVLDTACGTGEHAALFASWGLEVVGADLSEEMIAVCRRKHAGRPIEWVRAGLGETFAALGRRFDAVTCLGNSWPHVLTDGDAKRAAQDFAELTAPGGVVVIQQLNYAAMRLRGERLMGPQVRMVEGQETLFLRLFDLDRDPVRFTMVKMTRGAGGWAREDWQTEHRAWHRAEMEGLLREAGFGSVEVAGDFARNSFDPQTSDQMIVVAER